MKGCCRFQISTPWDSQTSEYARSARPNSVRLRTQQATSSPTARQDIRTYRCKPDEGRDGPVGPGLLDRSTKTDSVPLLSARWV